MFPINHRYFDGGTLRTHTTAAVRGDRGGTMASPPTPAPLIARGLKQAFAVGPISAICAYVDRQPKKSAAAGVADFTICVALSKSSTTGCDVRSGERVRGWDSYNFGPKSGASTETKPAAIPCALPA